MKFFMERRIAIGDPLPLGYRANWDGRALLAVAKLADKIHKCTTIGDYARILLERSDKTDSDFIEVHIYGTLHRKSIEKVVVDQRATRSGRREDRIIAESIADSCRTAGVQYEAR